MKLVVINGSPAGCRGASARYVQYLQQQLPRHCFQILEVAREIYKGKIATAIFTSAHFYDHTAHDYIAGVSCDLDMAF